MIAETSELPTRFAKIAVTDDRGRYVIPDLPKVRYNVWVRGYGLVDSPKVTANPGKALDLKAVVAPTERAAAEYYPAGTGSPCCAFPITPSFPVPDHRATASPRRSRVRRSTCGW